MKVPDGVYKDCHWWSLRRPSHLEGCAVLTCLLCAIRGKCSFYETNEQYRERQDNFARKHPKLAK